MKLILLISTILLVSCSNESRLSATQRAELELLAVQKMATPGRYQYVPQSGGYINRGKLIDTATGKIWQDTCYRKDKKGDCAASAWTEETVLGLNYEETAWNKYLELTDPNRKPSSVEVEKEENRQVRGYVKSNGTYVAPYIRTSPNSTTYDNIRPKK